MADSSLLLSKDMRELLETFQQLEVQFLVVGAHAVNSYTEARLTKDLDVWVNPTLENARRVYAALKQFGAPLDRLKEEDFFDGRSFFVIGVRPNRIDILQNVPGLEFPDAWSKRRILDLEGFSLTVPCIEDVLRAKLAAGRPQDLIDAEKLKVAIQLKSKKT